MKKQIRNKRILRAFVCVAAVFLIIQCLPIGIFADEAAENEFTFESKDGGFLGTIAIPFGWIMRMLNLISPTYIITLLFFAIVMKVILFPFGIKQQKNMVKQASLRPKEAAIRKKYAGRNDKTTQQKVQQEIMDLYQKENFNPAAGCLPLLLQMPILFALFQVVYNPLKYIVNISAEQINQIAQNLHNAGYILPTGHNNYDMYVVKLIDKDNFATAVSGVEGLEGKLDSVADLPNLTIFGIQLGEKPSEMMGWYLLVPILTFVIVYLTSILTKKFSYQPEQTADSKMSGCIMDWVMPLMSAWFAFTFPAVLGIYWMFQNILGVLQQILLKKMFPTPVFSEEDYLAAEKELLGKNQNKKKKPGAYKRHPNSLHHIDDDEDEIAPPSSKPAKKTSEPKSSNDLIAPAPLKDEEKD